MAVKVGSFTKSTNTSVPVSQAVTGVGFQPKALILWTSGNTSADTWEGGFLNAFGVTTGASASLSISGAQEDDAATTNCSGRVAEKALTIVQWGESLLAECDLTSFDAGGFTLSWTANNAAAYIINYMAIGGEEITAAKLVKWTVPASTGDQAVTGVGFQPTAVLHFLTHIAAAMPASAASSVLGYGAMDASHQWSFGVTDVDGRATVDRSRQISSTDRCLFTIRTGISNVVSNAASFVSMDADGFTVTFNNVETQAHVGSLCLAGNVDIGSYDFTDSGNQAVTGVGFIPGGVLQIANGRMGSTTPSTGHKISVGAMGVGVDVAAFSETVTGSDPSEIASYTASDKVILVQNTTGDNSFDNVTDYVSMDADGFTVSHSGSTPNSLIGYLAIKAGAAGGNMATKAMHYRRLINS